MPDFALAQLAAYNSDIYRPHNPVASAYYKCVENHFEEPERARDCMNISGMVAGGQTS